MKPGDYVMFKPHVRRSEGWAPDVDSNCIYRIARLDLYAGEAACYLTSNCRCVTRDYNNWWTRTKDLILVLDCAHERL